MSDTARILQARGNQMVIERTTNGKTCIQAASLIREGQRLNEMEVLSLSRRENDPTTWDVTVLHKGPPRANTPRYRDNHETIFGQTKTEKKLLN